MFSLPPSLARSLARMIRAPPSAPLQLELYSCLESVLGSLTWEGAPTWRGVVVSRDVEKHFGGRVEAARQVPLWSIVHYVWPTYCCTCRVLCCGFRARVSMHAMPYSVHAFPPVILLSAGSGDRHDREGGPGGVPAPPLALVRQGPSGRHGSRESSQHNTDLGFDCTACVSY